MGTLRGEAVDSLPLMPITMMFAADTIGAPYGKYAADHDVLVEGQLATARKYGFDYVSVISDPAREAADLGAAVRFFEDAPPAIDESNALLSNKSKLESLDKLDPLKPGSRSRDRIKGVKSFARSVKGELLIEGWVEGPCAEAADLRGINNLMLDFMDDPDFVLKLFEFNIENATRFAIAQLDAGADIIGIGDAAASLVGPKIFKQFVQPFEKRLIDAIHGRGGLVRLHICGNISRSLREIGELGADILDIDWMVPLDRVRREVTHTQVVAGNIDPVAILRNGNSESITAAVRECHNTVGKGYILAAGCEIPRDTPPENVEAFHNYARSVI